MDSAELSAKGNYAIEEPVNFHLNRPLATFFVDFFYKYTPVTPNQVTLLAMVAGVIAGLFLMAGDRTSIFIGALLFQLSQVLDCVDGQLARRKNMRSAFGRMIDGAGDYIVGIAVFGGIAYRLWSRYEEVQLVTLFPVDRSALLLFLFLTLISTVVHSLSYDYIKTKFYSIISDGVDSTEKEKRDFLRRFDKRPGEVTRVQKFLLSVYKLYTSFQQRIFSLDSFTQVHYQQEERVALYKRLKSFFRLWSWLGPNSHFLWIVLAALFGDMVLAMLMIIFPMNLYFFFMLCYTRRHFR